jgi:hypothetical protein
MAVKAAGNVSVTYDSVDITQYVNTASIAASIAELDTTDLASTAMSYIPGLADWTCALEINNYVAAADTAIMEDLETPPTTLKTLEVEFTDAADATVTYTWTTSCFPTGGTVGGDASGLITISGVVIRCNGAPSRAVA